MKLVDTRNILIADINPGNRLREVDPAWVEALASEIQNKGQLQSIGVILHEDQFLLGFGMHRVAAKSAFSEDIRADIYELDDAEDLESAIRLLEVDENLIRHELNALDHAVALAERKQIYETLYPETKKGAQGGRSGQKNETDKMSFSKETAEKIGMSPRSIERAVKIAFQIPPTIRSQIRGTNIADNQSELLKLAELDERTQKRTVELLVKSEAKNVNAAVAKATGNEPIPKTPEELQFDSLTSSWSRAGSSVQKQFLDHLKSIGVLEP